MDTVRISVKVKISVTISVSTSVSIIPNQNQTNRETGEKREMHYVSVATTKTTGMILEISSNFPCVPHVRVPPVSVSCL